jgi:chemotaxis signal transduction protein
VLGVIHLNGVLESVLDARKVLGLDTAEISSSSRILMTSDPDMRTGLLFDDIVDIVTIPTASVKKEQSLLPEYIRPFADGIFTYKSQQIVILGVEIIWKTVLGQPSENPTDEK